jgi:hypothetical protein
MLLKNYKTFITIFTIAASVSCSSLPVDHKINPLTPGAYSHSELCGLYLTTDKAQMTGVPKDSAKLSVNESIIVYARGMDDKGKWFVLPEGVTIDWKADSELNVDPASGTEVAVKVLKKAVVTYVTASAETKNGEKIKKEFAVMVK